MARAWIEDRKDQKAYKDAVRKAKEAGRPCRTGRWRVRWTDAAGKECGKIFERKTDADKYRQEIEGKFVAGTYRDPAAGKVKLSEIAETWHAAQAHLKPYTVTWYRRLLDVWVLPQWGNTSLDSIRHEDVAAWVAVVHKKVSASRTRSAYRVLSLVLGWAVKSGRLAVNPAHDVKLPRSRAREHVYLTYRQIEALADAAGEYRAMILLLAYTGLRWGEAENLQAGRVDLVKRRARIVDTKTHVDRTIPLPGFLVPELEPLVTDRPDAALVFAAPDGGRINYHNWRYRVFNPAVAKAKIPTITAHHLRHTAASMAIAEGADVKIVQAMLGHATATMTLDLYGHLWPDRLDTVADRLDAARSAALS